MSGSQSSFGMKSCFGFQSLEAPANNIWVWMCLRKRSEVFLNCSGPVVLKGVGQYFRPSPSRDWKFLGGVKDVQRLWQARFFGRVEIIEARVRSNCIARLWPLVRLGSATKP